MFAERRKLPVFQQKDLDLILQKFNLFEKMKNGKLFCSICNEAISANNFGCLYLSNNEIQIACSKPECLGEVSKAIENV